MDTAGPRVRQELFNKYGKRVSLKKVARLMRANGLNARQKRKYSKTTDSNHTLPVSENILNQEFHAEKAGQKWVSDIIYLRTIFPQPVTCNDSWRTPEHEL